VPLNYNPPPSAWSVAGQGLAGIGRFIRESQADREERERIAQLDKQRIDWRTEDIARRETEREADIARQDEAEARRLLLAGATPATMGQEARPNGLNPTPQVVGAGGYIRPNPHMANVGGRYFDVSSITPQAEEERRLARSEVERMRDIEDRKDLIKYAADQDIREYGATTGRLAGMDGAGSGLRGTPTVVTPDRQRALNLVRDEARGNATTWIRAGQHTRPQVIQLVAAQHRLSPGDAATIYEEALSQVQRSQGTDLMNQGRETRITSGGESPLQQAIADALGSEADARPNTGNTLPGRRPLLQAEPSRPNVPQGQQSQQPQGAAPQPGKSWQQRADELRSQGISEDEIIATLRRERIIR
jgi:hypothetical protein